MFPCQVKVPQVTISEFLETCCVNSYQYDMKFLKISAPNSNVFSIYVNLKFRSILPGNCKKRI